MDRFRAALRRWLAALPLPRPTVRLQLTLVYGGLLLLSSAALLTVTYLLVSNNTSGEVFTKIRGGGLAVQTSGAGQQFIQNPIPLTGGAAPGPVGGIVIAGPGAPQFPDLAQTLTSLAAVQRDDQLHQLLIQSGVALGGVAVLSIAFGWLIAGRLLRPLRTITNATQNITASDLHRRLNLGGPNDELKELGDTVDGLLARLEASFAAQRQFIANASHELRTPLARQRTVAEVALRDPAPTVESLQASYERVLSAGREQERLIEAMLTLARSERGLEHREPCDLAAITGEVLLEQQPGLEKGRLTLDATLGTAVVSGDPDLIERMVTNLVDNAVRYNVDEGSVRAVTQTHEGDAVLCITNTGPVLPTGDLDRMFEPFQRLHDTRSAHADGVGLGLSIVHAVAVAHGARIGTRALPDGGLEVRVVFAAAS